MSELQSRKRQSFYGVGLNYEKADVEIRGDFTLEDAAKKELIREALERGHSGILAISTCNRTEVYGFAENPYQLIKLLCEHTQGSLDQFEKVAFVYKNREAIHHLFEVGAGLDSQILGDFEIIGQVKQAFILSKKIGGSNPFLERLVNSVIQASKRIKNETGISSGATSVSFASVHYIMNEIEGIQDKKITLFGTGKIGRNTIENLVKHTNYQKITLINRTREKAEKISEKFDVEVKDYANLQEEIRDTDILIVATGAQNPTINKELLYPKNKLHILDLSVPKNVADDVEEVEKVNVVHVDELSKITNDTLTQREQYIPDAQRIIEEVKKEFEEWQESRKFVPTIKALKSKLNFIKEFEIANQQKKMTDLNIEQAEVIGGRIVQKIMNNFARHLREDHSGESLELIQNVFQLEGIQE